MILIKRRLAGTVVAEHAGDLAGSDGEVTPTSARMCVYDFAMPIISMMRR